MRLHLRSAAWAAVLCTGLGAASAEEPTPPLTPPPAPNTPAANEAPPLEPPAHLTKLDKPVPSPLHPRLRLLPAATLGGGVYCPDYGSPSLPYGRWCTPMIYFGLDGPFSDMHVSLLFGDVLRYGALIGFELGTPYMQLGGKRSRAAMALRGSFDLLIAGLGERIPGQYDDGLLGFSNTYGPHLSIAVSPRAALEIRGAVGWTVGGFFSNHDGFDRPEYRFVVESWIGVRVSP
jgi:hypothetical protein